MKWAVVIEKSENGYAGYAPDFPRLGVVGDTPDEVRQLLAEAMELYLEEVGKQPERKPAAEARVEYLELGEPVA